MRILTCASSSAKSINCLKRISSRRAEHADSQQLGRTDRRDQYLADKCSVLAFSLSTIDARLRSLTAFGADIFILHDHQLIPLWKKESDYDPTGLDYLIANRETYYVRRLHELTIKQGDRVAIVGRGIGVVKESTPKEVVVVLGKKDLLSIAPKQIIRDHQNNRWEWNPMSAGGSDYASSNLRASQHQRSKL